MKKQKYIFGEFNETGINDLDITDVVKNFGLNSHISKWGSELTIYICGKKREKVLFKSKISQSDLNELIPLLNLVEIPSTIFNSGSTFYRKEFVDNEIDRLKQIFLNKRNELNMVENILKSFQNSL